MTGMDYDSTTKFITSLAKFLQSLCNGYVDFNNWVQINGHLILSVDSGETKEFVVNEKLCKTLRDDVSFLSNSYHAPMNNSPIDLGSNNNNAKTTTKTNNNEKVAPAPVLPTKGRGRKQAQPQKLSQEPGSPPFRRAKQILPNETSLKSSSVTESESPKPKESDKVSISDSCVEKHSRPEKEQQKSSLDEILCLVKHKAPEISGLLSIKKIV